MEVIKLFDLNKTIAKDIFDNYTYPWLVLPYIKDFILELGDKLSIDEYEHPSKDVWISKSAKVFSTAYIIGPCIIDHEAEIRHCAFIRGNVIIGKRCVVGNSTELKNAILFDNVQVPHYNYVGDSILGYKAHMGAGAITSNVKSDKSLVKIKFGNIEINTGLNKVGAFIGDEVEVGCGSVLCPGCIIGKESIIYPLSRVRGIVKEQSVYKEAGNIVNRWRVE